MRKPFRAEKEFGLIVGGVMVLLSAWWVYRGRFQTASQVLLSLGSLLILAAFVWPRLLVWPNRAWMALAAVLSYISTRVILAFVFFFVVTPIGIVKRAMGWDPLRRRMQPGDSYWHPYRERSAEHYEKMY